MPCLYNKDIIRFASAFAPHISLPAEQGTLPTYPYFKSRTEAMLPAARGFVHLMTLKR
jgi:hypothetical protein